MKIAIISAGLLIFAIYSASAAILTCKYVEPHSSQPVEFTVDTGLGTALNEDGVEGEIQAATDNFYKFFFPDLDVDITLANLASQKKQRFLVEIRPTTSEPATYLEGQCTKTASGQTKGE